jgi:glyoxylate reductase
MTKVYITRQIPQPGIDLLKEHFEVDVSPHDRPLTREEFLNAITDMDGVLCLLTEKIDAEVFDAAPKVRGFANYAVGYDNLDVAEATARKIPLSNTPGVLTDATAEMAWALLFAAARRVVESDTITRSGNWPGWGPLQFIGGDVTGKTLGIVGAGRIGTAFALKSSGFSMKVLYSDSIENKVLEDKLGAKKTDLNTLVSESDFISIHCPLLSETIHLFDTDVFKRMKKSAYLINTARGPIVNEADLVNALREGEIAGAGIDVYEKEPKMTPGLNELDNIVITPHIASATVSSRTGMALLAARNLIAMIEGKKPETCINPEIYG